MSKELPVGVSVDRFTDAARAVLAFLAGAVPLQSWAVTRYDGERQVVLEAGGARPLVSAGDSWPWEATMCQHSVSGAAPSIAPDVAREPLYAATQAARELSAGAYVGIPIRHTDGRVFGTICGIDATPRDESLLADQPLLELLANLLSTVLDAELESYAQEVAIERAGALAETDPMTGLLNRRGWDRVLALEEQRTRRYGDPCTVLVLDLDGLKRINDTLGHAAGDRHLRAAADVLVRTVRGADIVARLGGDEFGIVAARSTEASAELLLGRLTAALDDAQISCSIGMAQLSIGDGAAAAWHQAAVAMYAAKRRRKAGAELVGSS